MGGAAAVTARPPGHRKDTPMTNHHNGNPERDHLVLDSGPGWEHRGRRKGADIEVEIWRREDCLVLPRAGLRYLIAASYTGTERGRQRDDALLDLIKQAILVLRDRDGVSITPDDAMERARNIVAALVGNYLVDPLEGSVESNR